MRHLKQQIYHTNNQGQFCNEFTGSMWFVSNCFWKKNLSGWQSGLDMHSLNNSQEGWDVIPSCFNVSIAHVCKLLIENGNTLIIHDRYFWYTVICKIYNSYLDM